MIDFYLKIKQTWLTEPALQLVIDELQVQPCKYYLVQ